MDHVLFVCATERDRRETARLAGAVDIRCSFHDFATTALEELVTIEPTRDAPPSDALAEIERLIDRYRNAPLDAVVSTDDYPGTALASIVARTLGLPTVDPAVQLRCQHKYHSRRAQRDAVPEATPAFELLNPRNPRPSIGFPLFVKPVKTCFSVGASCVRSPAELRRAVALADLPDAYLLPFRRLLSAYTNLRMEGSVLAEALLEGRQVTLDGYAHEGAVHVLGVVDSLMFPGTISFARFEYPSRLPPSVLRRMEDIAVRLIEHIGYRDGMFNIEFMFDERSDSVWIIEINPRMSSQFADLFEKVDGTNSYAILLDLARGRTPRFARRQGAFARATSYVLRTFSNFRVTRAPTHRDVAAIESMYPDARVEVFAREGRNLSQELQDGQSFRYGLINIGGRDDAHIEERLRQCVARLPFVFEAVVEERELEESRA